MNMKHITIFLTLFFVIISVSTIAAEDIDSGNNGSDATPNYVGSEDSTGILATDSKETTELLEEHSSNYKVGNDLSINGSLKDAVGNPKSNADILLDFNGVPYGDTQYMHYSSNIMKTSEDGSYSYSYRLCNAGTLNYSIQFNGDGRYGSNRINRSVFIHPKGTQITVDPIKQITTGDRIEVTGKLTSENIVLRYTSVGVLISSMAYGENHFVDVSKEYARTDENGFYTYIYKPETAGRLNICVYYPGYHNYGFNQTKVTTFVLPKATNVTVNPVSEITLGDDISIAGYLTYGEAKPLRYTGVGIKVYYGNHAYGSYEVSRTYVRTDNEGFYNFTFTPEKSGNYFITGYYPGYHDYAYSDCTECFKVNTDDEVFIRKIYQNNDTSIIVQGLVILNEKHQPGAYTFERGHLSVRVISLEKQTASWVISPVKSDGTFYAYMTSFDEYNKIKLDDGLYSILASYSDSFEKVSEFSSSLGYFEIDKTGDNVKLLRYSLEDDSLNISGDTFKGPGKTDIIIINFYINPGTHSNLFDGQVITENPYDFREEVVLSTSDDRDPAMTTYRYFKVNPDGTFSTNGTFPYYEGLTKIRIEYHDIGIDLSKKIDVYNEYYYDDIYEHNRINIEKSNLEDIAIANII